MKIFSVLISLLLLSSCREDNDSFENSTDLAFNLVKVCVDSAIKCRAEINTTNYVVDLSAINNLQDAGQNKYTVYKSNLSPTSHEDSIIVFEDPEGKEFHVAKSMIIKFDSIRSLKNGMVNVWLKKFTSHDNITVLDLQLKRSGRNYVFIKHFAE